MKHFTKDENSNQISKSISRRRFLKFAGGAAGAVVIAGGGLYELVNNGDLPGKSALEQLTGACNVSYPPLKFSGVGSTIKGSFNSKFRNKTVGYTIGLPHGYVQNQKLPLIVMLHGYGGNNENALVGMTPAQAASLIVDNEKLPDFAIVTVDGGNDYWNPHPHDNPMAMVVDELIPMCQALGLGAAPSKIGLMGISMGGFGDFLIAERYPKLISAVAAISPAIWLSYDQARAANFNAFASQNDFNQDNVLTHATFLKSIPVRVASGYDDPFYPDVMTFVKSLPQSSQIYFGGGCHTDEFFISQEPPSLKFLANNLS